MPASADPERGAAREAALFRPATRAMQAGQLRAFAFGRGRYPGRRLRTGHLPGVEIVGFWDAAYAQAWGIGWHRNEGIELMFQESGSVDFVVSDQHFQLTPGDMTFTRPWQQHQVGNPHVDAGRLHFLILDVKARRPHQTWKWPSWIILAPKDLRQLTDILRHNEQPVWHATADIGHCFRRIGSAVESDYQGNSLSISRLAVYLNRLLLSVLEMFRGQAVPLDQSLSAARRTVELFWGELRGNNEHLTREWTVSSMAKRCSMGVTNFIQQSRQLTNMTPCQYLNHCRLALASELLRNDPTASVTHIALTCGFASSQYFATLFRRHFGVPPRAFRRQKHVGKTTRPAVQSLPSSP
jgi:AraC family L-rhamnose operon regulatory protein RhaS